MEWILVRHGVAADRATYAAGADAERPLTPRGEKRFRKSAAALASLAPVRLVATSPLARATRTAELWVAALHRVRLVEIDELRPGVPVEAVVRRLRGLRVARLGVVGHEPELGKLLGWLTGVHAVDLKKGAACSIGFPGAPRREGGVLRWLLQPKQLRGLA